MNERERADTEPEVDAPEQTWGQGEGRHEPTIPEDEDPPQAREDEVNR